MKASQFYSRDYAEARSRFVEGSRKTNAILDSHAYPTRGPGGEALSCDVAWHGPEDAEAVLVTLSATHGVEGFCGSGVQLGWLESGLMAETQGDLALLQIHAINPHGFAWLRRVTEANVDLNRNFVDHGAPYPVNQGYEELAEVLCPREWNDAVIAETDKVLNAYAEAHGNKALQEAFSAGQYSHAGGIFYGGSEPDWSHRLLMEIFRTKLRHAKRVAVIDYHTGLGPRGYGERICIHAADSAALARAETWYEGDVTSPELGTSASVELLGFNVLGMEKALPEAELTSIALEFGTLPTPEVRLSLRADNWLHQHGQTDSPKGRAIKAQIREAFFQDQEDWQEMVFERALETQRLALRGLVEG